MGRLGRTLQRLAKFRRGGDLIILNTDDREDWRGQKVREASVGGDYEVFYIVNPGFCGRCKSKLTEDASGEFNPICPNCGAKRPEGEIVSS